jgi:DNA-binding NtrC family response regulator
MERGFNRQGYAKERTMKVNRKILLIDEKRDSPVFIFLQQEGYSVIACESAQKAWGLVYPLRPRVIIIHLPNPARKDLALLQECRALADGVPVLVAASFPALDPIPEELKGLAAAFISVPLKSNAVEQALDGAEGPVNDGWQRRVRRKRL